MNPWRWPALAAFSYAAACSDPGGEPNSLYFPTDLRAAGYREVRSCRAPGEHSGLGSFTVWVDPGSAGAFEDLWAAPQRRDEMPPEAIVVKAMHVDGDCSPNDVAGWVAMKKEPGFDPANGDWRWQEADAGGTLIADGAVEGCIACHRGSATTSCTGYGAENGRDYLCTEP